MQDQRQLATENPDNPLLQVRGNAGTHDIELGRATLKALMSATASDAEVRPGCRVPLDLCSRFAVFP